MAQRLYEDKIPVLTESSGTITLAAGARLTIGGQQYITSSALNVSADTSTANARWQVYAVVSGGVVSLVISQNENSVGPAGYTSWKLVGCYVNNGESAPGFGTLVNIEGVPATQGDITWTPAFNGNDSGNMNGDFDRWGVYSIIGNKIVGQIGVRCIAAPTASGSFSWAVPVNQQWRHAPPGYVGHGSGIGSFGINDAGSTNSTGTLLMSSATQISAQSNQTLSGGLMGTLVASNSEFDWAIADSMSATFTAMMLAGGLGYTPIKDL
jgi:hypothetical protein